MSSETIKPNKKAIANMKRKGIRQISIDKAVKVLADYRKNHFNGYRTLIENGYSELTALAKAGKVINSAKDKVAQTLKMSTNEIGEVSEKASNLYAVVGISREQVLKEYQSIIEQNINLAVKLRALEPLIRQEGVKWDEKDTQQAQSVSIVLKEVQPTLEVKEIETI